MVGVGKQFNKKEVVNKNIWYIFKSNNQWQGDKDPKIKSDNGETHLKTATRQNYLVSL